MFKLGVVSDSHRDASSLKKAAALLSGVDAVAHLGDMQPDAMYFAVPGRPLYSIAGNCDYFGFSSPGEMTVVIEGKKLLLCHGHLYRVKHSLTRLSLRAREAEADMALYGHTHIPSVDTDNGVIFVNPGALMLGRFCVIEFRPNGPVPVMYTIGEE